MHIPEERDMEERRIATQDEFGNWEVDPLYQELMDRLECDSPAYNEEKEESVACGKCRRCTHTKEGIVFENLRNARVVIDMGTEDYRFFLPELWSQGSAVTNIGSACEKVEEAMDNIRTFFKEHNISYPVYLAGEQISTCKEVTCPKCNREYTYDGNDLFIFEAEGECHNCHGDIGDEESIDWEGQTNNVPWDDKINEDTFPF